MKLFKLAIKNFFRNTRRSILSSISVMIAITAILFAQSYIQGIFKNINENIIALVSGHINITTQEYKRRERLLPLSESITFDSTFIQDITSGEVTRITPRIKFGVLLGEEELSVPALGYAFIPEMEKDISNLDARIAEGSYIATGERSAILGIGLAKRLNMGVGDTLTIITRTVYDSPTGITVKINGLFETGIGGVDRSLFYIPLDIGQYMLDMDGEVTEVVVQVKDKDRAMAIARDIQARTGLLAIPFQHNTMLRYLNVAYVIYGILYFIILLVACSTIANTMIMVIFERTREIGMMKALGLSSREIITTFIIEASCIGFIGSLVGTIIGSALSYWLKFQGLDITFMSSSVSTQSLPFGPVIYLSPTLFIVFGAFIFGFIATIVVAYLPISRVTRMEPAQALRAI